MTFSKIVMVLRWIRAEIWAVELDQAWGPLIEGGCTQNVIVHCCSQHSQLPVWQGKGLFDPKLVGNVLKVNKLYMIFKLWACFDCLFKCGSDIKEEQVNYEVKCQIPTKVLATSSPGCYIFPFYFRIYKQTTEVSLLTRQPYICPYFSC